MPFPDISQNEAERGERRIVAEKLVDGGFAFTINIMVIDGGGKGYLAVTGAEGAPPVH